MAEMMDLYNEAENSVLGTLIADAEVNASLVFTRVRPEDFVTGISRQIFETCRAMYGRGDVIDPLTVKAACGSEFATWLKELEQITPSARYCGAYMNNVVADDNDQRSSTMTDLLTDFYGRMGTERQYLDWGFDELNRYVKVNPKHYVVVGARPSAGKTAFALQVALHMAEKHNVTFFSLETDSETVEDRIMAAQAGVDLAHIQSGNLDEAETVTLVEAKRKLADRNFHFYEATGVTVDEIRAVTCRNKSDIIVVDYLQLVRSSDPKHIGKEYETITEVTTALQRLAKSGVCVIALSQLSRGGEGMAALRGSGQIEQDADVVMLLDYPSEKDVESDEEVADLEAGRLRVIEIVKNKGGRRGSIPFWFCGSQQRFLAQWQGFYQSKLRMMEDDATA